MIRRVVALVAGLVGLGLLLAAAVQAANGLSPFFTAAGGLLLLAAALGLLFLATLAPPAPRSPPPSAVPGTPPLSPQPDAAIRNPGYPLGAAIRHPVDPLSPEGRQRPGTVQIRLPGTTLPLHPDDPDDLILTFIQALTPADFEHFCRVLLEAMGYEQVRVQGKTGDEGVDLTMHHGGVLVIAQCKRYTGNVGAPALRDFYGTLMHTGAAHGFFITTSGFTQAAQDWAAGKPIQLVGGGQLVTAVRRYLL
jgi:hypothetical protein